MTDPIPVNLAAIQQRAAQKDSRQLFAKQEASKSRFVEDVERGFNPEAAEREEGRHDKFRSLESRRKQVLQPEQKITEVEAKTEEDLAKNYNRRNPELPSDKLRDLRNTLKPGQTPEEILNRATEAFEDPTLVDEAMEYLEKSTEGETKENVRKARTLLNELKGREVIAGRNVDAVAKNFYQKGIGQSPTELRNLYRDITGNPRDHNTLFSELSKQYSFDSLKLLVAFLLKGMAYDLKSKGPSIQQAELMRLMTEIRNLQSILWVYLFFRSRMRLIKSQYSLYDLDVPEELTFELLAKEFIRLVEERYPSVMKLLKQAKKFRLLDDLEKMIVFSQYRDAIRQLSPRLYQSMRHRQNLLLVILETLEELEERLEEEDEEA
ncbi:MAG: hypothetical protein K940chlam9_01332 [Chlamydiae bacterium]|nr:hypothetical protein [Chlamydiota bacterium]